MNEVATGSFFGSSSSAPIEQKRRLYLTKRM